jgi:CHRD domain/PEP-CTERM motif
MTRLSASLSLAALLAAWAPASHAAIVVYESTLGAELPGALGSGTLELTYDSTLHTLGIDTAWSGISGTTTVAHIHCCTALPGTGFAGVAVTPVTLPGFPVGLSSGTYTYLVDLGQTLSYTTAFLAASGGTTPGAEARLIAGLDAGVAYFNIHSTAFPSGEIRGFPASQVPLPGTLALTGLVLAGLALRRRRAA